VIRVATLALALLPAVAAAQPAPRPGLGAAEARRAVDGAAAPWTALVRVQSEAGGQCTGVLVAPDRVLTAAHCLVAARTRAWVRPGRVHVLAGYDRGAFRGHAVAAEYRTGGFDPAMGGPHGADWAVLRLAAPLASAFLPVAVAEPGMAAMLGGWQRDRAHVLLADTACRIEAVGHDAAGPLLRHDCAATRGSSGGPLLVRLQDGWAVAGVQSAALREGRGGVAVPAAAVPLE
jgi:protease YdgD